MRESSWVKFRNSSLKCISFYCLQTEAENRELRDQLNVLKDVMIRMSAVQKRKANLERYGFFIFFLFHTQTHTHTLPLPHPLVFLTLTHSDIHDLSVSFQHIVTVTVTKPFIFIINIFICLLFFKYSKGDRR